MRHIISTIMAGTALVLTSGSYAAPEGKPTPEALEEATRLQIFLDNANFGPGKIDGRGGEFTRKAVALYREAQGLPAAAEAAATEPQPAEAAESEAKPKAEPEKRAKGKEAKEKKVADKEPINVEGLDLSSVEQVFTEYEITEDDAANVGELPKGPEEKSKLKALPYANLAEAIAEKFHSDVDFIKELNPGVELKAGARVKVPNVRPFELATVKQIKPGAGAAELIANDLGEDAAPAPEPAAAEQSEAGDKAAANEKNGQEKKSKANAKKEGGEKNDSKESGDPQVAQMISVIVGTKDNMAKVFVGQKLTAAFPVTVGSSETSSPVGDWKVKAVAKMPTFRYDESMLKKGERSSDFHMLPPGPNSPVGVMWIALNKKGIGLHGTDDPDTIGRASSHGCIRLANWDVVKLAELVKSGVSVKVE